MAVHFEREEHVAVITIDRPEARNAVNAETAGLLYSLFKRFDADDSLSVAVLTGAGGQFCAGYDLKEVSGSAAAPTRQRETDEGPLGCSRLLLSKPVIAAVEGHAVAGGLELALWCDMRVAAEGAVFGVYCRRWGVPLMDGGTVRLPRLIGQSQAMDMILTGRGVSGEEARTMGLANRLVPDGQALPAAKQLAHELAALPPICLRSDRLSVHEQWGLDLAGALANEAARGANVLRTGESRAGAARFAAGEGRHGKPA
jgi:enoyl-CoA hydratase